MDGPRFARTWQRDDLVAHPRGRAHRARIGNPARISAAARQRDPFTADGLQPEFEERSVLKQRDRRAPLAPATGGRLIDCQVRGQDHAVIALGARGTDKAGWTSPALVGEDGGLITGHARVLAARQLGIAKIPVMVAAGWTEAQKRAYVLANGNFPVLSKQPVTSAARPLRCRR